MVVAETATPPTEDLPLAANGEVKAYDRLGNKVTVPKDQVGQLYGMGGRVARKQEVAEAQVNEDYDKRSTLSKAGELASVAGPVPLAAHYLATGHVVPTLPPSVESYRQGVGKGFTAGLGNVAEKELVRLAEGDEAAKAYAQRAETVTEANPTASKLGVAAGLIGGAVAGGEGMAGKFTPSGAIGAAGGVGEQLAGRALTGLGVTGRTALGRALMTGSELAARGAIEGALTSAAMQWSEDKLGDRETSADKVFAAMGTGALYGGVGGAALGAGGSLAASGVRAATESAASGLSRVLTKVSGEVSENEGVASKLLGKDAGDMARSKANDLAFDALGTTRKVADKANAEVRGGTNAIGDYVNRRILKPTEDGASLLGTAMKGRADDLLPAIQADKAVIGGQIGDLIKTNPAKVAIDDIVAPAVKIADDMAKDPTRIGAGTVLRQKVTDMIDAFSNAGKLPQGGSKAFAAGSMKGAEMSLSDLYYARAEMEGIARELGRGGQTTAKQAVNEWLRDVDGILVHKLDDAAKAAGPSNVKAQLLDLKREYQLASWAEKAAKDGTNRIAGNNGFGLREGVGMAVGLATGHAIPAIATGIAGKLARERGAASAAYLLTKVADMGVLTDTVKYVDDAIARASKGLLAPPKPQPYSLPSSTVPVRARATQALATIAALQADPERVSNAIAASTQAMSNNAPNLATSVAQRHSDALALLTEKMPVQSDPDPLDPHPAPKMTDAEAASFMRTYEYVQRPMKFFEDLERGKLTFEGAEVARRLMPAAFQQLQTQTLDAIAEMRAANKIMPFQQRQVLGALLDIPATPSQRVEHGQFLQANVQPPPGLSGKINEAAPAPPKRPFSGKTQPSSLDRLEGK